MSGTHSTDALVKELIDFCRSESLSEDGLREIIERYGCDCAPNNNHVDRNYEFFSEACNNKLVTEGILRCLLEYFPRAASCCVEGLVPLHMICYNKHATRGMVQLVIDAHPESLRREDNNNGITPLHTLSKNKDIEDATAVDILGLLLERYPEAAQRAETTSGALPIHIAAGLDGQGSKSFEFCRMLIEAYPGSERIATSNGMVPFHIACRMSTVALAKYLFKLYPESINVANRGGGYPIHEAIVRVTREAPTIAFEMVQMLLDCDPNVGSQKLDGSLPSLPLYVACFASVSLGEDDAIATSKANAALKIAQALYDAYPEAIEEEEDLSLLILLINSFPEEIKSFVNTQLTYTSQARDGTLMSTRDENGQLPLHRALRNNVTLGSIKLLVKGNRDAVRIPDHYGWLPLHLAILNNDSTKIVDYLVGLDSDTPTAVDRGGNTALHYACRSTKHGTIALLLEKYDALSVSKRNVNNKLPIDLLFESDSVSDREGFDYIGSIFQLIRAYPESVMGSVVNMRQEQQSRVPQGGKKRKLDQM